MAQQQAVYTTDEVGQIETFIGILIKIELVW